MKPYDHKFPLLFDYQRTTTNSRSCFTIVSCIVLKQFYKLVTFQVITAINFFILLIKLARISNKFKVCVIVIHIIFYCQNLLILNNVILLKL